MVPKEMTRDEKQLYVRPVLHAYLRSDGPLLERADKRTLFEEIAGTMRQHHTLDFIVERQDVEKAVKYLVAKGYADAGHIYRVPDGARVYRINLR